MKKNIYVTYYTKEQGKLELTRREWGELDNTSITLHREDGPAKEWHNNSKEWYVDGKRHRINGPAIEWCGGDKFWHVDGKRHRINGPAVEWGNGNKEWWINGKAYAKDQYNQIIQEAKSLPLELRLIDPRWWVREIK